MVEVVSLLNSSSFVYERIDLKIAGVIPEALKYPHVKSQVNRMKNERIIEVITLWNFEKFKTAYLLYLSTD
jgi:hypothetical protein